MSQLDPGGSDAWTAAMATGLAKSLATASIGMEPDVLAGARKPGPKDAVVLFPLSGVGSDLRDRETVEFRKAGTAIALLAFVARVATNVSKPGDTDAWIAQAAKLCGLAKPHPDLAMRLRARYRMLCRQGVKFSSLKAPTLEFSPEERVELVSLLTAAANAGRAPSLETVRVLEQIYAALQMDERLVYTQLHSSGQRHAEPVAIESNPELSKGAVLDPSRIAQLRRETEAVSPLPVPMPAPVAESPFPGLDAAHAEFAGRLLVQTRWSRRELEAVAAELRLMPDSAVERINDAALDHLGEILLEGDDSIEVHMELLEGLTA
jgi:hypothetical protein